MNILKVNRPSDYSSFLGVADRHPLVCVIDYDRISPVHTSLNDYGEKAHSFYFSSDAYKKLTVTPGKDNNKLFMVIPGASHTDLYDRKDKIPFDAITYSSPNT